MKLTELTPRNYSCQVAACLGIYEITPENQQCGVGACPSIHNFKDHYLIIGEKVNPKLVGLENKVGEGEVLIKIKKEIIDNKK